MNEKQLIENLVKLVDDLMSGIGHVANIDIDLLNDTLIQARIYLAQRKYNET